MRLSLGMPKPRGNHGRRVRHTLPQARRPPDPLLQHPSVVPPRPSPPVLLRYCPSTQSSSRTGAMVCSTFTFSLRMASASREACSEGQVPGIEGSGSGLRGQCCTFSLWMAWSSREGGMRRECMPPGRESVGQQGRPRGVQGQGGEGGREAARGWL